ncbi:MAG: pyridoxamine 5'-phosphate oxidase family protein, partial [Gammaproteobacteria bacterium]|nr:pyridoxamine 5'-phosphate oxidase family protein [Gammaproteobacteria bacterium]
VQNFPITPGARQIFEVDIDLIITSCGMSVPFFDYKDERGQLNNWAEKKGTEGLNDYWLEKNKLSLDGRPTGIIKE